MWKKLLKQISFYASLWSEKVALSLGYYILCYHSYSIFFSENLTFDQKVAILGLLFQLIKSYCEGIFEHDKNLSTSTRDLVLIWVIVNSVGIRGTGYCDEVPLSRHAIVLLWNIVFLNWHLKYFSLSKIFDDSFFDIHYRNGS